MRCALLLLCLVFYDCKKVKQRSDKHLWSYDDESRWPGDRCKASGGRQSPIDIKSDDVIKDFNKVFIKYGSLQFRGYDRVLVSAINNGHTVQFSTEGDVDMQPILTGGPLKQRYRLEQVHFHWLSEHAIDGFKYPLEMHFVHVRVDLSVPEALNKRDGLAIVAIFCNVQADLEESKQVPTEEIMKYMPHLMEMGDRVSGVILDMTKLLSKEPHSYYTYMGSLTSPACNEAVIWIIFNTPLWMSDAQYNQFGKISNGQHNFRSLQKVKRQQVFMPVKAGIHTPQMIIFLERVVKIVAEFFSNITRSSGPGSPGGPGGARAPYDTDLITQVVLNRVFNTSRRNAMLRRKIFFT